MSEVGRFGVFLPSYVWEGDGPERARGIKAFARTVEDLGFDSLFITDHLLAAKRFYSVNWLEPLHGAGGRGRRDRARPARHLDPDHAAAQPGDPRQGAGDAPVPVRQPGHPRRRRRLERRRVRGGRRPQVGARQAHRRDARHHDAAARGRDGHATTASSTRSTTCSSSRARRSGRCSGSAAARSWPTRSRPTCPKFVESVKARTLRADGWIPRPTCPPPDIAPRLGRAPGVYPRGTAATRATASSRTRTSCTSC